MLYITIPVSDEVKNNTQISFDDILFGTKETYVADDVHHKSSKTTRTLCVEYISQCLKSKIDYDSSISAILDFNKKYAKLIETKDKSTLYRTFHIPKKSGGGLREINAPNDELMEALRELKYILEHKFYALYHTSAYAYVRGRSTMDCVRKHQSNESRWFLKMDFHNFFGSTTPQFVEKQLSMIFPFCELLKGREFKEAFSKAMSLCFLHGGLPQGTPISPLLTNLIMIPIDYTITKKLREKSGLFIYTRYADDMYITNKYSFRFTEIRGMVVGVCKEFNAPYDLNAKKTRYGSSAGRNWILGVMLNKDNNITIGHEKKRTFKAMLFHFLTDYKNNVAWELNDVQILDGLISYYKMVEGDAISEIMKKYDQKFSVNTASIIKARLKSAA